jgi:hypothetical protein
LDDSGPKPLRNEENFHDLAQCTLPTSSGRDMVNGISDLGTPVRDGGGEANPSQNRQIQKVVTNVGDLLINESVTIEELIEDLALVELIEVQLLDAEFYCSLGKLFLRPPGKEARDPSCAVPVDEAGPVMDVIGGCLASITIKAYAPVGQDAIDIGDQQANLFEDFSWGKTAAGGSHPIFRSRRS